MMEEPLVLQTVPLPQDCTTHALLLQVWYCPLVPAATQTICPLLLAEQVAPPVGVDVADVVVVEAEVLTVVVFVVVAFVVVVALVVVVVALVVVVVALVGEAVVVVVPVPPQVPVLIDATTLKSSPLSLETSQTIAPAKPLHKA